MPDTIVVSTVDADRSDLAAFASKDDPEAFARLARRYRPLVHAVCLRRLDPPHRHLAEDATQAVFLALAFKAEALARRGSGRPLADWLLVTARYVVANLVRAERRRRRREQEVAAMPSPHTRAPDAAVVDDEFRRAVLAAVDRLPRSLREAVTLRHIVERPHAEVATRLGISPTTLTKRLQRGLERLREALGPTGTGLTESVLLAALGISAAEAAAAPTTASLLAGVQNPSATLTLTTRGSLLTMSCSSPTTISLAALLGLTTIACAGLLTVGLIASESDPATSTTSTRGFDEHGYVTCNLFHQRTSPSYHGVSPTADGGCLAVGSVQRNGDKDILVARFLPDGRQDLDFGEAGSAVLDVAGLADQGVMVREATDGSVVLLGTAHTSRRQAAFAVMRLSSDGTVDTTFGEDGRRTITFGTYEKAYGLALQDDGKIVVSGAASISKNKKSCLARLLPDGSLDPDFGQGGKVVCDMGGKNTEGAYDLAVSDKLGVIVVAGSYYVDKTFMAALACFNISDGSTKSDFGSKGILRTPISDNLVGTDAGCGIDDQGRIYWAGFSFKMKPKAGGLCVFRSTPTGELDESFAEGGINPGLARWEGELQDISCQTMALQPDGKALVLGYAHLADSLPPILARYGEDGDYDPRFGAKGVIRLDGYHGRPDLAIQGEGNRMRILVPCTAPGEEGGAHVGGVLRLLPDGRPDQRFGSAGMASGNLTLPTNDKATALLVDGDGKLLAVGRTAENRWFGQSVMLRFDPEGLLDEDFGEEGRAQLPPGPEGASEFVHTHLDAEGRIVVVGRATMARTGQDRSIGMFIGRFLADGSPDRQFGKRGVFFSDLRGLDGRDKKDELTCGAPLPDGGVIAAGVQAPEANKTQLVLVKLDASGRPVRRFGEEGIKAVPLGLRQETALAIAPLADGKILIAGSATGRHYTDGLLVRFLPDGSLDEGFGDGGKILVNRSRSNRNDRFVALHVDAEGRILVAGDTDEEQRRGTAMLMRFTADGEPDGSFGKDGALTLDVERKGAEHMHDLRVDEAGITVCGATEVWGDQVGITGFIARFGPDGASAPGFGSKGVWTARDPRCATIAGLAQTGSEATLFFLASGRNAAKGDILLGRLPDAK